MAAIPQRNTDNEVRPGQAPSPFHPPRVGGTARRALTLAMQGAYFLTICTRDRACLLGEIVDGEMRLDPWETMAAACRQAIPHHFSCVVLDEERS